ncbi:MAG TPA: hypothetical protein VNO30_35475 [Kofleriaceae bacterium]|nr:hypothetical protein [Kofleriaceae bacterium]
MDAIVSGSANVALLIEGSNLWSLKRTSAGVERIPQSQDLSYILGDASDLSFLEDTNEAATLHELDLAHAGVKAIHLALMLCDPETSPEAARLGASELEILLVRSEVAARAERILDAKPMPTPLDLGIAVARCHSYERIEAKAFFARLAARQSVIGEVRRAWDALPGSLFAQGERAFVDSLFAREGVFRSLVHAQRGGADLKEWVAKHVLSPALRRYRAERLLPAWVDVLAALKENRDSKPGVNVLERILFSHKEEVSDPRELAERKPSSFLAKIRPKLLIPILLVLLWMLIIVSLVFVGLELIPAVLRKPLEIMLIVLSSYNIMIQLIRRFTH